MAMRGFHGVWEATTLESSLTMMKSGAVTRLRLAEDNFALDGLGVAQITAALLSEKSRIETLWMRELKIPSDAGSSLCELVARSTTLTELYLEDNALGDVGLVDMCTSALANNRTLRTLCLDSNGITGQALSSLGESLATHPCLTELSLSRNPLHISELGQFFDAAQANTALQILRLSGCAIGPSFPAQCIKLKGLEQLDLSNNQIEDLPNCVGAHETLRNVNLTGNTPRLRKRLETLAAAADQEAAADTAAEGFGQKGNKQKRDKQVISWRVVHPQLKKLASADAAAMAKLGAFATGRSAAR